MKKIILLILCGVFLWPEGSIHARHHVELESTYLGEGWFRYRLRSIDDPFFLYFNMTFLTAEFPGFSEFAAVSNGWSSVHYTNRTGPRVGWEYSHDEPDQNRPYERVFFARTEHHTFKRGPHAEIGMSFSFLGGYHGYLATHNIVGIMPLQALVPCPPDEADGSATNLLERFTVIDLPDIRIDDLVRSGSNIVGFSFTYPEPSTVLLQGSHDFQAWTNVGYVYGFPGKTTFESSLVLNPYGNFFRVLLAAEGHAPLLTNSSGMTLADFHMPVLQARKRATLRTEAGPTGEFDLKLQQPHPVLRSKIAASGELTFSWPAADTNYRLESAFSVTSLDWGPVAMSPVALSNRWVLTNSVGPSNRFFRLMKNRSRSSI